MTTTPELLPIGNAASAVAAGAEPPACSGIESGMLAVQSLRPDPQAPQGEVFDHWLRQELSRLFDDVLAEPVPDHLLALLQSPPKR